MGRQKHAHKKDMRSLQEVALLAVVLGACKEFDEQRAFSRVDLRQKLVEAKQYTHDLIVNWPCARDDLKTRLDVIKRTEKWHRYAHTIRTDYSPPVLAAVCSRIVADLEFKVADKKKRVGISRLKKYTDSFDAFWDFAGANFYAFRKSDELLDNLYQKIDWRWR